MSSPITLIEIRSLSFTGSTFINLLLGCHPRAFTLGPPKRVLDMLDNPDDQGDRACLVHHAKCDFWPAFFKAHNPDENFFLQLANASGASHIIINNPYGGETVNKHLDHPMIERKRIKIVRDARAVITSYLKYNPDCPPFDAITKWFITPATRFDYDPTNPDELCAKYEDIATDPDSFLKRASAFTGLDYPDNACKYWEHEHHMTTGNGGPLSTINRFKGTKFAGPDSEYREQRYQQLLQNPHRPLIDERWRDVFTPRDRFVFDLFAGHINEHWGYERDTFPLSTVNTFLKDLASSGENLSDIAPKGTTPDNELLALLQSMTAPRAEEIMS